MKTKWAGFLRVESTPLALGCAFLATMSYAHAQPDINNAPKGENPPNWERGGRGGPGRDNMRMNMRVDQMLQMARMPREATVRSMLTRAGFTDTNIQDAVVAHLEARQKLPNKARAAQLKMMRAMAPAQGGLPGEANAPQEALTDEQARALINEYRAALEEERAERAKSEAELDAKIGFSKNPRLEMTLILMGALGEGTSMMGPGQNLNLIMNGAIMELPQLRQRMLEREGFRRGGGGFGGGFGRDGAVPGAAERGNDDRPFADNPRPFFERRPRRGRDEELPAFGGNGF